MRQIRRAIQKSLDAVAGDQSDTRSLYRFRRTVVGPLAEATSFSKHGRSSMNRDGYFFLAVASEGADGALLQEEERFARLTLAEEQVTSVEIHDAAVPLKCIEARIRQILEQVYL
jgi:hypothetical protein